MARATIKISQDTAARLRDAMVGLSSDAGRLLTIDGAIGYLLDYWLYHRERDDDDAWASLTPEQYQQAMADLSAKFSSYTPKVKVEDWVKAVKKAAAKWPDGL